MNSLSDSDALQENKKLEDRLRWKDREIKAYEQDAQRSGQIILKQKKRLVRIFSRIEQQDVFLFEFVSRAESKHGHGPIVDLVTVRSKTLSRIDAVTFV